MGRILPAHAEAVYKMIALLFFAAAGYCLFYAICSAIGQLTHRPGPPIDQAANFRVPPRDPLAPPSWEP